MFGFSKKKNQEKDVASVDEILQAENTDPSGEEYETSLYIPEEVAIPNEEKYVYAFHNSESPALKANQISLYGIELTKTNHEKLIANALIRTTVQKDIKFTDTKIILFDENKKVIASKEFDLGKLGNIPKNSAVPYRFIFTKEDIQQNIEPPLDDWGLGFNIERKHKLELEESWADVIPEKTKLQLEQIVNRAPALKPGEVNLLGLQAEQKDADELKITLLVRNGTKKDITLQQIPLVVIDRNNVEVAKGSFKPDDFTVKANTSKPWSYIFPPSMITKKKFDLSKWKVQIVQNQKNE